MGAGWMTIRRLGDSESPLFAAYSLPLESR
mgnify:CR=1 FL=1